MDEINSYDIEKIYSDMEKYLIANIKRNLTDDLNSFHKKEEEAYGFKWEAWQAAKLRDMQKFRKQNKDIINGRTKNISKKIAQVLNDEARQGKLIAFKGYKEALVHGYKSSVSVKDSFFKTNGRKVRNLIKSTTNDFKVANHATLRRSNDVYRQIIAEASMYNQTGVMTPRQAIRKAIQDFENRGINSIEYSNGAKHKISEYTSMAIRTASTRATLTGEGELRKKIGSTLILMSKHNTACKLCQPWENKVLIDDVYSGGSKEDGNYPLLSQAMKEGLYHPNCRHGHGTYFPELSKNINHKIIEKVEEETKEIPDKFVPANNIKDVEGRMKNLLGVNEIKLNNMNMGLANQYLEGMEMFLKEYPMMKDYTRMINTKTTGKEIAHFGIYSKRLDEGKLLTNTELSLRNPRDITKFSNAIDHSIKANYFYEKYTNISTIIHELTHGLEFKMGSVLRGSYSDGKFQMVKVNGNESVAEPLAHKIIKEARLELFGKEVGREVYDATKYLGSYAFTNSSEMLAQCISYEMTVGTQPFSAKVKEIFDKKVKEVFK